MSKLTAKVDRVRVEVEIDGETIAYELKALPGEPIQLQLDVEFEDRELPPEAAMWVRREPTGSMRMKLDAFGTQLIRTGPAAGERHG